MPPLLDRMLARASGVHGSTPPDQLPSASAFSRALMPPSYISDLDTPLLHLSNSDPWRVRDAMEHLAIIGASGSGKTTGSGQMVARAFLRAGFSGLVLCAKQDERERWQRYAAECGRERSVIVMDGSGARRLNFLEYEMARQEDGQAVIFNLVHLLLHVLDVAEGRKTGDQREEPFWRNATGELLSHGLDMLWTAYGRITLDELFELIHTRPTSAEQKDNAKWQQASFWHATIEACRHAPAKPIAPEDLRTIERYWTGVFAQPDQKTPGNIVATLSARLNPLLKGPLRQLFATTTNVVPEMTTHGGAILIVDLPIRRWHEAGILAQQIVKYLWQRAVEARPVTDTTRPVFLWADECQFFLSPYDAEFQSTARSARACTVYLTQNLPTFYAQIGGRNPEHIADSLLGNFQTKIFHANGDPKSNQWAADLIGKSVQYRRTYGEGERYGQSTGINESRSENVGISDTHSSSTSAQKNHGWGGGWSSSKAGGSWNQHYNFSEGITAGTSESQGTSRGRGWNWGRNRGESRDQSVNRGVNEVVDYELQPAEFSRLRKGGPEHGLEVDGIVFQGGRVWKHSRSTWLPCVFPQG